MNENKKITFGYARQTITLSGPEDSTLGEALEALATVVARIILDFAADKEDAQDMLYDFIQITTYSLEQLSKKGMTVRFEKPPEVGGDPHVNNTE